MNQIDIPNTIIEKSIAKRLVFFIGSGFSKDFLYPDWNGLVKKMIKQIITDDPSFKPFLEILENGKMDILKILEEIKNEKKIIRDTIYNEFKFDVQKIHLLEKHKKLLKISTKIITTNYDQLLENAANNIEIDIDTIVHTNNHMIGKLPNLESYIYKIHGDHKDADKCILLKEDYEKLYSNKNSAHDQFKNIITNNTIVFIGFSLSDPYVNNLFEYMNEIYNGYNENHFILSINNEDFSKYNIKNIQLKSHDEIPAFLDLLAEKIKLKQKPSFEDKKQVNSRLLVKSDPNITLLKSNDDLIKDDSISNIYLNNDPNNFSSDNLLIKDNSINYKFSNYLEKIKEYVKKLFGNNNSYIELVNNLDVILYVMDRIAYDIEAKSINEDNFLKPINELEKMITEIESNHASKNENLDILFTFSEWWLNKLYESLNSTGQVEMINMETDVILDYLITFVKDNGDYILLEKVLISAKDTFKSIKNDNFASLSLKSEFSLISEIVISLILPVFINLKIYKEINAGKVLGQIEDEDTKTLVESIRSEYIPFKPLFNSRPDEIKLINENLSKTKYIIIEGKKNIGKSMLIAEVLSKNNDVLALFLLFSFKKSKNIGDMVKAIVEQSNVNLINKINLNELDTLIGQQLENASKNVILKMYFIEALRRVIQECGKVFVVIDSLELIENKEELQFFLEDTPVGCNFILAVGDNSERLNRIKESLDHKLIILQSFKRDEIPRISGIDDVGKTNSEINDKIFEKTRGELLKIKKLFELKSEKQFNIKMFDNIDLNDENELIAFEQFAEVSIDNDLLEETLLLISLLEPIQPISLENIQNFLSFKNIDYKLPKIRNELKKISSQISDIRFNRIKLISNEYAKFILTKYFSQKDREDFIHSVFLWLATKNQKINLEFISNFIKNMKESELVSKENFSNFIAEFIKMTMESGELKKLYRLGVIFYNGKTSEDELAFKFLNEAARMESPEALSFLGYIYFKGDKIDKDMPKAENLLRKASLLGDIKAKIILSTLLFEGIGIPQNIEEGKALLNEAILMGSEIAKLDLAMRLLLTSDLEEDRLKGNELLDQLVDDEYLEAMRINGNRLLRGDGLIKDIERGMNLLKRSIEKGSKKAKFDLAKYLILSSKVQEGLNLLKELVDVNYLTAKRYYSDLLLNGFIVNQDIDTGLSILMSLVDEGDKQSELEYSKILVEGTLVPQNISKGQEILVSLVEGNFIESSVYFGNLLIDGKFFDKDIDKGINLLEKAFLKGDVEATRNLASRYSNGYGVPRDVKKGRNLFLLAIQKGDLLAKYQYGKFLIKNSNDCNNDKIILAEALKLLKSAASWGVPGAKIYLGNLFIDGEIVTSNINLGLKYLNEAIDMGNPEAIRELGYRLIFGITLPKDAFIGEEMLRRAISYGDILAHTMLGHAIITNETSESKYSEGFELLEKAAKTEPNAMRILGIILLKGVRGMKDIGKGERLLRNSHDKGDYHASLNLSNMLMDGRYLRENIEEGSKILLDLVKENNENALIEYSKRLLSGKGFEKDINKSLEILNNLSESNNLDAKFEYAKLLISGNNSISKNIVKGEQLLREGEAKGHKESRRLLGIYLAEEKLKERESNEGIKILEKSVNSNDHKSMEYLGDLLLEGTIIEKDSKRAISLFENAIKDSECKGNYALRLLEGDLIPKNKIRGIELLKEASLEGDSYSKYSYAMLLIDGKLIEKDVEKGYKKLYDLVDEGHKSAKLLLASNLIYAHRIERDVKRGIQLFDELVEENFVSGIVTYAELLIDGKYIPKDLQRGEKLLRKISHKSDIDVDYLLATRYLEGDGVKKHVSRGTNKLKKAVTNGMSNSAMLEYGIRLKNGFKLTRDEKKGNEYIEKAIKKATPSDLNSLGVKAYQLRDFELASELLISSYTNGYREAGTSLAYMIRRNELKDGETLPDIFNLLEAGLSNNGNTALINLIISLVKSEKSESEWKKADSIVKSLDISLKSIDWWRELAEKNDDAEGLLVLSWLSKYGKIDYEINYKDGFGKVMEKGWFIPKWMIEENDELDAIKDDDAKKSYLQSN